MNKIKWWLAKAGIIKYVKVKVYLRSGQVIEFKCKKWQVKSHAPSSGENGLQSFNFEGIKDRSVWFNIEEIVCVIGKT